MRKDLAKLQEEMKARVKNASAPANNSVSNALPDTSHLPSRAVVSNVQPLCSHCKRRVCRRGSPFCSRCTATGVQSELRDVLPGMEVKQSPIVVVEGKAIPIVNVELEEVNVIFPTEQLLQDQKYYTRKEVSKLLGVSPTSICRWEQKGKTPPPIKIVRTGQLLYTEEHLAKLKEYMSQVVIVEHQPRPNTPENQQHDAAKVMTKKVFKMNKGLERAVTLRLGRGGLGAGKLL